MQEYLSRCLGKMRPGQPVFALRQSRDAMLVRSRAQAQRKAAEGHGLDDIVSTAYNLCARGTLG